MTDGPTWTTESRCHHKSFLSQRQLQPANQATHSLQRRHVQLLSFKRQKTHSYVHVIMYAHVNVIMLYGIQRCTSTMAVPTALCTVCRNSAVYWTHRTKGTRSILTYFSAWGLVVNHGWGFVPTWNLHRPRTNIEHRQRENTTPKNILLCYASAVIMLLLHQSKASPWLNWKLTFGSVEGYKS